MFRVQRRARVPRVPTAAERVLRIIHAEPLNGDRQMPCEMLVRIQQVEAGVPVPPRPNVLQNHPLAHPRAVILAMAVMDNGEHAMALSCLRQRTQSEGAVQGINHSL